MSLRAFDTAGVESPATSASIVRAQKNSPRERQNRVVEGVKQRPLFDSQRFVEAVGGFYRRKGFLQPWLIVRPGGPVCHVQYRFYMPTS